ncbi:[FeFe] hydrogenase H-cluster maturation GTPase HydF [Slackia heliotrinireducens]|uniref:[FeFe] hydrogenase H-cluster maturation GTPase HydF n=1 Tax=Slackia heliotrinireducens TaxID=84110 RepID=UPI003315B691
MAHVDEHTMAGLNETPSGERVHIGFFGVRNAGKSSLVNAVTGQNLAVVSDTPGTTTDPVRKAMELLPVGPVVIVDTPGIDDTGELGELRVEKARRAMDSADVAVLVVDGTRGLGAVDEQLIDEFRKREVPYAVVLNKADLAGEQTASTPAVPEPDEAGVKHVKVSVSALEGWGINELKESIAALAGTQTVERRVVGDLVDAGDMVVLVIPTDSAAPKGRIILPQQQVIRDLLEAGASACATSVECLPAMLSALSEPPRLVITDSQAFKPVAEIVPADVPMTSFSILMARYKGTLEAQMQAVNALENLTDKSNVLISEGCTHHRQCDDIGTKKLPRLIKQMCKAEPTFSFTSGREFPQSLEGYDVVVHCGGCMLNAREMEHRMQVAAEQGVPFTNYGMAIAKAHGILERSLAPLNQE